MERADEQNKILELNTPDFRTEAEEAAWWPTQEDKLFAEFERQAKNGTLKVSLASEKRRIETISTPISLNPADIELAKQQAEAKGLQYQAYLEMILHEALHAR